MSKLMLKGVCPLPTKTVDRLRSGTVLLLIPKGVIPEVEPHDGPFCPSGELAAIFRNGTRPPEVF